MNIRCCKTANKNATDTRVIFEAGKLIESGNKVIIVSNDKIFRELTDTVIVFEHYGESAITYKLKKKHIFSIVKILKKNPSDDVYLSDIMEYYPTIGSPQFNIR